MGDPKKTDPIARNHRYDGWVYGKFIDPSLAGIRRRIALLVPAGSRVLDVGCGTGDQLRNLAGQISYGLGVELSEQMANMATREMEKLHLEQCEIQLADASRLDHLEDQSFDISMSSMVIHEMPEAKRLPVLREMRRLGRQIVLADWICPQPSRWRRWSTHSIEYLAGREHYAGFRSYLAGGGMPPLLAACGLEVKSTQITTKGTIQLWVCEP